MRKLFSTILVLGLLLCGNAYAFVGKKLQQEYIDSGIIKIGMKMSDLYPLVKSLESKAYVPNYKTSGKYLFLTTSFHDVTQTYLAEATNSNPKKNKKALSMVGWKLKNYKLIKIYEDPIDAHNHMISLEKDPSTLAWYVRNKASYIKFKKKPKIVEKPKKQEPKKKKPIASPDDNKIVAAGSGSGFIVSKDGTVITNYHVIEGCELNKVTYKGTQLEGKVLSIDKVNDIAILKTNINSDTAFSVSNEDVSLLEDVVVAGFPLGKQISSAIKTHKGVVTALAGAGDNYSFFQTDAAINQGNSGGPIINQKGNVIGIAVQTWVEEGVQGVHFGIKSSTLKTFASANGLKFLAPNNRDLSNKELGKLITESTVYVECHMTIANIKKMIAEEENKKAFFKDYQ